MRRWLTVLFTVLLSGVSSSVLSKNEVMFLVETMFVKPQMPELDYAFVFDSVNNSGYISSIHPEAEWGYHLNFGVIYLCTDDVNFHFRDLDTHTTDHVNTPSVILTSTLVDTSPITAVINVTDAFAPTFTFFDARTPFIATTATFNLATASTKTKFRNFDIELGKSVKIGNRMRLRIFEGARVVNLHQNLFALYTGANAEETQRNFLDFESGTFLTANITTNLNIERSVHERSNVEGIGPRVGLDTEFKLYTGLNLTTHLGTALIASRIRDVFRTEEVTNYTVTLTPIDGVALPDPVTLTDSTTATNKLKYNAFRMIPNWDLKLGLKLNYIDCYKHEYALEAGYSIDHYYNVVDRYRNRNDLEILNVEVLDTSFSGPYVNVQVRV